MATIIDGKQTAENILSEIAEETAKLKGGKPGLAVIIVGADPASHIYVKNKVKKCAQVGFHSVKVELPEDTSQEDLFAEIDKANEDPAIHGILVQLPLPKHLSEEDTLNRIKPEKDVDGFLPHNVGQVLLGNGGVVSCTPKGVMELLKRYNIETKGKNAVVVGRSNIVGKPMAALLMQPGTDATVTVCHSKTQDLKSITLKADILIAAIGRAKFITADMVKDGAAVIDVGMNRTDDGLFGDVDFAALKDKASAITPVPGGVGPMTIAMLLQNCLENYQNQSKLVAAKVWSYHEKARSLDHVADEWRQVIIDTQIDRFRQSYLEYFTKEESRDFVEFFFGRIYSLEDKKARDELAYKSVAKVRGAVSSGIRDKLDSVLRLNDITDYLDLKMAAALAGAYERPPEGFSQADYQSLYSRIGTRSERQLQLDLLFENFAVFYRISRKPMLKYLLPPVKWIAAGVGAGVLYKIFAEAYSVSRRITPELFDPFFEEVKQTEQSYLDRLLPP